jgi:hypothetical protein
MDTTARAITVIMIEGMLPIAIMIMAGIVGGINIMMASV